MSSAIDIQKRKSLIYRPITVAHRQRIYQALQSVGIGKLGLMTQEARYLPHIVHDDESIGGAVYGWSKGDSVMLVATDRRVIFLDKKPLFVTEDELTYNVVSGVSFSHAGLGSAMTLHTRIKDYSLRTFNQKSLATFVQFIEGRVLERPELF